ncbi:Phosphotransferase enzyme family protein [Pirellulimonas nuda]|uniref:Phosphotransferase enzyme family protein n=1 Tax=Pirellulimonas nuda TaxID=2528009 RepID=A0A518DD27_9BACT|nr:phosphotransferase [Pirellulimonas nuda]QDU89369.1 Phosphotransferase enzyme family protein [Pirellulimonas nuda]
MSHESSAASQAVRLGAEDGQDEVATQLRRHLDEDFHAIVREAFQLWCGGGRFQIVKDFQGGHSGAAVLKVDLSYEPGTEGELPGGGYILKVYRHKPSSEDATERKRHDEATGLTHGDAIRIPQLMREHSAEDEGRTRSVLLYQIAGESSTRLTTLQNAAHQLHEFSGGLALGILRQWARGAGTAMSGRELLEAWLKSLDRSSRPNVHKLIEGVFAGKAQMYAAGKSLVNPLWLYAQCGEENDREVHFPGFLHGDLHLENVLVERKSEDDPPFWLIDFALARNEAPIGFDQSYLEVSLILCCLRDPTPEQVANLCDAVEQAPGKERVPHDNRGLLEMLRGVRDAIARWHEESALGRSDEVRRQFVLSRVAAGLNWADKDGMSESNRLVALYYAAWNARRYVEEFIPQVWQRLQDGDTAVHDVQTSADEADLWQRIWNATSGFDSRQTRFVLIADRQLPSEQLRSIGLLPWSAVIDLDAESDESGLHRSAVDTLRRRRAVREFSLAGELIDFDRGTAWMMAAGWKRRGEAVPSLDDWRVTHRRNVRGFLERFRDSVGSMQTVVVILPRLDDGSADDRERLDLLADVVNEAFGKSASVIQLGAHKPLSPLVVEHIPLQGSLFLRNIADMFGSERASENVSLPSIEDGDVEISMESLREFEEDLELLHSRLLSDPEGLPEEGDSEFWRGSPPTWHDINANFDVPRDAEASIEKQLRAALTDRRIYTVELRHQPGSGGTTLAHRLAWNLRREHPVAILRKRSQYTADLIGKLFHTTGLPVLLVADAGTITDAERLDLMSDLRDRNCRLVMLYVKRVFGSNAETDEGKRTHERSRVDLSDPMSERESGRFFEAFSSFTDDSRRISELKKITDEKDYRRYRSPFFYGLITFERDFKSVQNFVRAHTSQISRNTREALEYLSLLTRFSKISVHESLVKRLMNLRSRNFASLREAIGDGPWGLLLSQDGRVKILHPVIAEEVLRHFSENEDWRLDLADLSMRLIEDLANRVGSSAEEVIELIAQLFINREDAPSNATDDLSEQRKFSELIDTIDFAGSERRASRAMAGQRVLETLVDNFDRQSHFWNHLGRHRTHRLSKNFDVAVDNLDTAIRLEPNSSVHHHQRGSILRYWIKKDLVDALRRQQRTNDPDAVTPVTMLNSIQERFEDAQASFAVARDIAQYEEYSYVTEIQMILAVAKMLKRAAKSGSMQELQSKDSVVGEWLAQNMTTAEDLFHAAREVHGRYDVRQSSYLRGCLRDMDILNGNLLKVIKDWEAALSVGATNPKSRRGLAHVYVAKSSRDRSRMPQRDARRVTQLIEKNLSNGGDEADYRLWFNAYCVLPEFDLEHAIYRLQQWSDRHDKALRANYYLYVLEFVAWFHGERLDAEELLEYEHRMQEAAGHFPRIRSYEWLGFEGGSCPIVGEDSLGDWVDLKTAQEADAPRRFWSSTSPLRRINGVIDRMNGPQSGRILIGDSATAFFVPGTRFWASSDRHKKVNFFLGFSYNGLRAWMVEEGHVENGDRRKVTDDPVRSPLGAELAPPAELIGAGARQALMTGVRQFLLDMLEIREVRDEPLLLTEICDRLDSALNSDNTLERLGFGSLESLVATFHDLRIASDEGDGAELRRRGGSDRRADAPRVTATGRIRLINATERFGYIEPDRGEQDYRFTPDALHAAQWADLRKGQRVSYVASRNGRTLLAKNVSLSRFESHPIAQVTLDLREQAAAFVKERLYQAMIDLQTVSIAQLENGLRREVLGGMTVRNALGYPSLEDFLDRATPDVQLGASKQGDGSVTVFLTPRPKPLPGLGEALITAAVDDESPHAQTALATKRSVGQPLLKDASATRAELLVQVCDAAYALLTSEPHKPWYLTDLSPKIRSTLKLSGLPLKKQLGRPLSAVLSADGRFELPTNGPSATVQLAAGPRTQCHEKRYGGPAPKKQEATEVRVQQDRRRAIQLAIEIVQTEPEGLLVSRLASLVAQEFGREVPLRVRLGMGFTHLLQSDNRFEITAAGPDAFARLSTNHSAVVRLDGAGSREVVGPEPTLVDQESIPRYIRRIVQDAEPNGIPMVELGNMIRGHLADNAEVIAPLRQILGGTLSTYIEHEVQGVGIVGEKPRQSVRVSSVRPK